MALYRLSSFCSVMAIPPEKVGPATLVGFFRALEAEEIVKNPRRILKHTIAHWNMCRRRVTGWPDVTLSSPFKTEPVSLPLSAFPEGFRRDLERWARRLRNPDPLDPEAPARPLRQTTMADRVATVVRFASALVRRGDFAVDDVTGLGVLVDVDRFKSGLRFFLERAGNRPTPYIAQMATVLLSIARHVCKVDERTLAELTGIRRRLDLGRCRQMTPRNRERLRQFDDPANVARLLRFPEDERKRGLSQKNPARAAKCFERALAAALFIHCSLRIGTLRKINRDTDLSWAGGKCYLSIDGARVKTDQPLEFELPDEVASLLREYVRDHRPRLAGSDGPYLFPGRDGGPRPDSTMRTDFANALRKRAGLVMNPHLARHTIAKIVVERNPDLYVPMSRQLGHKRIDMTMAHYLGTETRASARHINRLLRDALADPTIPEE